MKRRVYAGDILAFGLLAVIMGAFEFTFIALGLR